MPGMTGYSPTRKGCTHSGCGTQDTVTVDGVHGGRCQLHPPTFLPERAVQLAIELSPAAAATYCRTDLP